MALNPFPYDWGDVDWIVQPAFAGWLGALTKQLLVMRLPVNSVGGVVILQPSLVWRVMEFWDCWFTPSRMSISPLLGQSGPTSQLFIVS